MSFENIRSMLEAIENTKVYSSNAWKYVESKFPQLAKDLKRYVEQNKYDSFVEYVNQIIDANHNDKTSSMFPKLDVKTWEALLNIVKYMVKEDPKLKKFDGKMGTDVWKHERVVKENLNKIIAQIEVLMLEE